MKAIKWILLVGMALGMNNVALADDKDDDKGGKACPTAVQAGYDTNYGAGTADATRCMQKSGTAKVVLQINKSCRDTAVIVTNTNGTISSALKNHPTTCASNRAYALGNLRNMIKDYKAQGINYDIVAIVHSGGGFQMLKNPNANQFHQQVTDLMNDGVKFKFCLNTAAGFIKRGVLADPAPGIGPEGPGHPNDGLVTVADQLIDGVEFVSAGITAIPDYQSKGYKYAQP